MNRSDYFEIMGIIDALEHKEKTRCKRYIEMNPGNRKAEIERNHQAGIYIQALMDVRRHINDSVVKNLTKD